MKTCSRCKKEKKLSEFSIRKNYAHQPYCIECNRAYHRLHYKRHKSDYRKKLNERQRKLVEWYNEIKGVMKCQKCGESHIAALDFHHPDPSVKEFNVSHLVHNNRASKERILLEIKKCEILCKNCHAKVHYELRNDSAAKLSNVAVI